MERQLEGNPIGQFYASASPKVPLPRPLFPPSLPDCSIIIAVLHILREFDYKDCINQIWAQVKCVMDGVHRTESWQHSYNDIESTFQHANDLLFRLPWPLQKVVDEHLPLA